MSEGADGCFSILARITADVGVILMIVVTGQSSAGIMRGAEERRVNKAPSARLLSSREACKHLT